MCPTSHGERRCICRNSTCPEHIRDRSLQKPPDEIASHGRLEEAQVDFEREMNELAEIRNLLVAYNLPVATSARAPPRGRVQGTRASSRGDGVQPGRQAARGRDLTFLPCFEMA